MPKFMAMYVGSVPDAGAGGHQMDPEAISKGMDAWGRWMEENAGHIVDAGGPLGKTKRISAAGIEDTRNSLTGYVIVESESHAAAAQLFEEHPHFTIFPGEAVEVMECLPMPGPDA